MVKIWRKRCAVFLELFACGPTRAPGVRVNNPCIWMLAADAGAVRYDEAPTTLTPADSPDLCLAPRSDLAQVHGIAELRPDFASHLETKLLRYQNSQDVTTRYAPISH